MLKCRRVARAAKAGPKWPASPVPVPAALPAGRGGDGCPGWVVIAFLWPGLRSKRRGHRALPGPGCDSAMRECSFHHSKPGEKAGLPDCKLIQYRVNLNSSVFW